MDLRGYSVPPDIGRIIEETTTRRPDFVTWYQPFIFSKDVIVGTAALWNAGYDTVYCTEEDDDLKKETFLRESQRLGDWFDYINDILVASFPSARTFLDFGCNNGHFGFNLASRGKVYTGIDRERNRESYEIISKITGIQFEYIGDTYDEGTHSLRHLAEDRVFDCAILSSVIMHLTDPHYAMAYFAPKIAQGVYFSTLIIPGDEHKFKARMTTWRAKKDLPFVFEFVPTEPLAESLLRFAGFEYLYRIPYREGIDPDNTKRWRQWVAARRQIPQEAIDRFSLQVMPDRREEFADVSPPGFWGSKPNLK